MTSKVIRAKTAPNGKTYLNVGCGTRFSLDWNNIDLLPQPGVIKHDILHPLPYAEGVFDVVYSSHVLEHLRPKQGEFFIAEQFRVLKKGGCCRVAVPDLEKMVRDYLDQLDQADEQTDLEHIRNYQWTVMQIVDQQVREETGGEMLRAVREGDYNRDFILSRCGDEFGDLLDSGAFSSEKKPSSAKTALRSVKKATREALRIEPPPRTTGEVHRWMYDRLSLRLLLERWGFTHFAVVDHNESRIPAWDKYLLDTSLKGPRPRKPDSIFVEATKP